MHQKAPYSLRGRCREPQLSSRSSGPAIARMWNRAVLATDARFGARFSAPLTLSDFHLAPGHKGSYAGALDQTNASGGKKGGWAEGSWFIWFRPVPCLLYASCFHFFRPIFIRTFLVRFFFFLSCCLFLWFYCFHLLFVTCLRIYGFLSTRLRFCLCFHVRIKEIKIIILINWQHYCNKE